MDTFINEIEEIIKTYNMGFITNRETASQIVDLCLSNIRVLKQRHDEIYTWMAINKPFIRLVLNENDECELIYQFMNCTSLQNENSEFYQWFLREEGTLPYNVLKFYIKQNQEQ